MPATKPLLLLVDDVPANLKLLESTLRHAYRLKLATSGAIALELARRNDQPDLLLLDLHMPGLSGIDVLRQLRADPATQNIPVIFVTADDADASQSATLDAGADDYVNKPISTPVLLARVRTVLRRKAAEAALSLSEEQFRTLFETMDQGVVYQDAEGLITQANPAAERILGLSCEQLMGKSLADPDWRVLHKDGTAFPADEHPAAIVQKTGKVVHDVVMGVFNPSAERYSWIQVSSFPRHVPGTQAAQGVLSTFTDISRSVSTEHTLELLAATDSLTGIRNRRSFFEQAHHEFARIRRHEGHTALLMMDLDHFKIINDSYGHDAGDLVLKHFTHLVSARMRETDLFGRLGGEEFAMLLPDTHAEGALYFAWQLLSVLEKSPAVTPNGGIAYTASIGVAMARPGDVAPEKTLARADQALYQAKRNGRNRVELADDSVP